MQGIVHMGQMVEERATGQAVPVVTLLSTSQPASQPANQPSGRRNSAGQAIECWAPSRRPTFYPFGMESTTCRNVRISIAQTPGDSYRIATNSQLPLAEKDQPTCVSVALLNGQCQYLQGAYFYLALESLDKRGNTVETNLDHSLVKVRNLDSWRATPTSYAGGIRLSQSQVILLYRVVLYPACAKTRILHPKRFITEAGRSFRGK
ncbi:hypothetical protein CC78DRAFT_575917 [Lojkania enalia]|uniref:Uncharacterized protein n=1 Tax=Lojkania enalia TaxID=147567 RepID=A0A9P4KGV6_9PLEO|nr:hypothetical protein CC78DRAFT_575917 [Didymosphaeria enalia]